MFGLGQGLGFTPILGKKPVDTTPANTIRALPAFFQLNGQDANLRSVGVQPPTILTAGVGAFAFTGEDMTPMTAYALPAGAGTFTLTDPGTTKLTPPVAATTTWNPADKAAAITLSGSNLIATNNAGTDAVVRSVASHSTGKYYAEFKPTDGPAMQIGLANSTSPLTTPGFGGDTNSVGTGNGGNIVFNGVSVGGAWGFNGTDVLGIAVDLTAKLFWVRDISTGQPWNNSAGNSPETGVGGASFSGMTGPFYAAAFSTGSVGRNWTANFGASPYVNAGGGPNGAPVGYGNW